MTKIKLALAEDQEVYRNGLLGLMTDHAYFELTQVAKNGQELLDLLDESEHKPDVILMDIEMPLLNGFETSKQVQLKYPEMKVLFLSSHQSDSNIEHAILSGAHGFLSKDEDVETLFEALEELHEKGFYFNGCLNYDKIRMLLYRNAGMLEQYPAVELTETEIKFLRLLCQEKTDSEIANLMHISFYSAETYRKKLINKLGVKKSIGLVVYAMQHRLW